MILNISALIFVLIATGITIQLYRLLRARALLVLVCCFAYGSFLRVLRLLQFETAQMFSLFYFLLTLGMYFIYRSVKKLVRR